MNGQALDLFGPGRYTLESQNMPLVGKFLTELQMIKHHFTVRYILLIKQSKWQLNGEQILKLSILSLHINFQ